MLIYYGCIVQKHFYCDLIFHRKTLKFALYRRNEKKKSLGNNPLKINIDNSGEGKETQTQNQRTTMTVNWENIFGNKINPL